MQCVLMQAALDVVDRQGGAMNLRGISQKTGLCYSWLIKLKKKQAFCDANNLEIFLAFYGYSVEVKRND